jgi:hypothetical protein
VFGANALSAKARVFLILDGLEARVWGERADGVNCAEEDDDDDDEDESEAASEENHCDEGLTPSGEIDEDRDKGEGEEDLEGGDNELISDSNSSEAQPNGLSSPCATPHPASRTPSPSPSTSSPSLDADNDRDDGITSKAIPSPSTPVLAALTSTVRTPLAPLPSVGLSSPSPVLTRTSSHVQAFSSLTHTSHTTALLHAERALSRLLVSFANADPSDSAPPSSSDSPSPSTSNRSSRPRPSTLAHELPPTNLHLFLLAPRRFTHPAWSARQKEGRGALDGALRAFVNESGLDKLHAPLHSEEGIQSNGKPTRKAAPLKKGILTDGVYVSLSTSSSGDSRMPTYGMFSASDGSQDAGDDHEEDELIWWGWDGQIAGFADW